MQNDDIGAIGERGVNMTNKKVPKLRSSKKMVIFGLVTLVLVGLIVAVLLSGKMAIAFSANSKAVVIPSVCTMDDIVKFNSRLDTDDNFGKTIDDISKRSGYNHDVNCMFMRYMYFYDTRQYIAATESAARIQELVESGQFVDNRIDAVQSIETISQRIENIESSPDGRAQDDDGTIE